MKLSYVISTQPTRFEAVTLASDFEATVARLAALGYDGVELAVRDPARLDVQSIKRVIQSHHLQVPAIGTGQAFVEENLSFTDPDESVRARAVDRIKSHIEFAREFNAIVIIGLIRGKMQEATSKRVYDWLVEAIKFAARVANENNVRLAVEPINRYETNLLNTVAETLALIEKVGADNIGVLFDTFHANIEEAHIEENLRACDARLFHVHVADSNRWAPGFGHTDFSRIIATLREMKYAGWISAEILQKPDMEHAAKQTVKVIKPLLEQT